MGRLIVSMQQGVAVFQLESLDKHAQAAEGNYRDSGPHNALNNAHIADSSPALERPSSTSSIYST